MVWVVKMELKVCSKCGSYGFFVCPNCGNDLINDKGVKA